MNILVLNGSPKGKNSATLQTSNYLSILHPEVHFSTLHVGTEIRQLEKDFSPAMEAVAKADVLLFSYPVYTFLVPSQLHRFLELLKEHAPDLKDKYASQVTTSKHFYDVTAHAFIRDNCEDLGLKYIRGLSADMEDLPTRKGQADAEAFFDFLLWSVQEDRYEKRRSRSTPPVHLPVLVPEDPGGKKGDVVIVADLRPEDTQLRDMILRFRAVFPKKTRIVNIRDFPFRGGCLSCFRCAADGTCVYKDGFAELLRENIQTAEAIVLAFTIRDHSMGSVFKTYDDRQFCNGHRTVTMGKPFGYLVSGNLSEEENLRTVIHARAETGGNFLAGVATDELSPNSEIDALAASLSYAIDHAYAPPSDFYGVGGRKIFRDLIWQMQGLMRADHKFFKAHGQYDFPQKHFFTMLLMYLAGAVMASPKLRAKAGDKISEGMLAPYRKVLRQAERRMNKER
jgi:multimeric flavodoxin WrbA